METSYFVIILTGCAGIVGFLLRMFVDNINGILNNRKNKRIEHIDFLLSDFYMPIYILLHRENTIWNKIQEIKKSENSDFIIELDKENLNNHLEIQKIIMSNIAKASPQNNIADKLIKYDEHVTIFKTLRKIGSNKFPSDYDSKYPTELYDLIEKRINDLKKDKKLLLGLFGNTPIIYKKITYYTNKLFKNCSSIKNNENESDNKESNNNESNNDESNNNESNNNESNNNEVYEPILLTEKKIKHSFISMTCSATQNFTLKKNNTTDVPINTNDYTNNEHEIEDEVEDEDKIDSNNINIELTEKNNNLNNV